MSPGVLRRLRRRPVVVLAAVIGVIAIVVAGTLWALRPRSVVGAEGPVALHAVTVDAVTVHGTTVVAPAGGTGDRPERRRAHAD